MSTVAERLAHDYHDDITRRDQVARLLVRALMNLYPEAWKRHTTHEHDEIARAVDHLLAYLEGNNATTLAHAIPTAAAALLALYPEPITATTQEGNQ